MTIASEDHGPGRKGLHGKTKRIKFNGIEIINGELANGNKVFDNMGNN
jgi:hypothetical protein